MNITILGPYKGVFGENIIWTYLCDNLHWTTNDINFDTDWVIIPDMEIAPTPRRMRRVVFLQNNYLEMGKEKYDKQIQIQKMNIARSHKVVFNSTYMYQSYRKLTNHLPSAIIPIAVDFDLFKPYPKNV